MLGEKANATNNLPLFNDTIRRNFPEKEYHELFKLPCDLESARKDLQMIKGFLEFYNANQDLEKVHKNFENMCSIKTAENWIKEVSNMALNHHDHDIQSKLLDITSKARKLLDTYFDGNCSIGDKEKVANDFKKSVSAAKYLGIGKIDWATTILNVFKFIPMVYNIFVRGSFFVRVPNDHDQKISRLVKEVEHKMPYELKLK